MSPCGKSHFIIINSLLFVIFPLPSGNLHNHWTWSLSSLIYRTQTWWIFPVRYVNVYRRVRCVHDDITVVYVVIGWFNADDQPHLGKNWYPKFVSLVGKSTQTRVIWVWAMYIQYTSKTTCRDSTCLKMGRFKHGIYMDLLSLTDFRGW